MQHPKTFVGIRRQHIRCCCCCVSFPISFALMRSLSIQRRCMQAPGTRYVEAHFVPKAFFRVSVSFLQSFIITHAPSSYIFLCAFWTIIICTAQLYYTRRFKKRNVFCWETYKFERPITHRADSLRIWLM